MRALAERHYVIDTEAEFVRESIAYKIRHEFFAAMALLPFVHELAVSAEHSLLKFRNTEGIDAWWHLKTHANPN